MKSYELKQFNDFLKIPPDRLETCLNEFKEVVALASAANLMALAMGDTKGVEFRGMVWNDDGEKNLDIKITVETE